MPDKPSKPESPRLLNMSYDNYLICVYSHPAEGTFECPWCGPNKIIPIVNPPQWDILQKVVLQ